MRSLLQIAGLVFILLSAGCASQSDRAGVNNEAASIANAELGVAYLSSGQHKVAMFKLKKALEYDDKNANAHHYIAELYRRLGQNELAAEHFKTALELMPEDSSIKNNYGVFLCGTGSFEQGLKLLTEVLADPLYSDKAQAYENMGLCAEKQGNVKIAEQHFLTALKLNSKLPGALLGMAKIEFDNQKIKSAAFYFEQYNKVSEHTAQSLWLGVLIERKNGHKDQSGSYAILLKNKFPDSNEAKFLKKLKIR
jgi:type IV pilus assembly protein PilF